MVDAEAEHDAAVPGRGDIWWLPLGPTVGHEQSGRRPALILSPEPYNGATGLALMCPITSVAKGYPFEVELPSAGQIHGVILSDHVRSIDWRARRARFASEVPEAVVAEVLAKVWALHA